jgi:multidrug resistance efflux pump
LDAASRERHANRVATSLARDADTVRAEQSTVEAQVQAGRAQLERAIAAVEQEQRENEARRRIVLAAPREGTIGALNVHAGQWALPGQTLATCCLTTVDARLPFRLTCMRRAERPAS